VWNFDSPHQEINGDIRISVDRVLYSYDGPQIFISTFGIFRLLFVKVEEEDNYNLFIASEISDSLLSSVVSGKLAVRAAFERDIVYMIKSDTRGIVYRYWTCLRQDIPDKFLPDRHIGLPVSENRLPNSPLQLDAYFAMSFQGKAMKRSGMPFSLFKGIVDSSYDAARRILSPPLLAKTKSATFDFQIARPQFSSLVVALEMPIINEANARRAMKRPDISKGEIAGQFDSSRSVFFNEMSELVSLAEKDEVKGNFAAERFYLLDNISNIIPNEENKLDSLEFNANISGGTNYISIDEGIGDRIARAYKAATNLPIRVSGPIFLTNASSRTFSIIANGREITCALRDDSYSVLQSDPLFRTGSIAVVTGVVLPRKRRDYLSVEGIPLLSAASTPSAGATWDAPARH
jgi:hypothetical protein